MVDGAVAFGELVDEGEDAHGHVLDGVDFLTDRAAAALVVEFVVFVLVLILGAWVGFGE